MLLFMDGFDHYAYSATALKKWDSPFSNAGYVTSPFTGRFGTGGMAPNGSGNAFVSQWVGAQKTFSTITPTTMIIGMAIKFDEIHEEHPWLQIIGSNNQPQIQFWLDAVGGTIKVQLADPAMMAIPDSTPIPAPTFIADTGYSPPIGLWFYFEAKIVFSTGSSGSVDIQIDSTPIASYSGIKTANTGLYWKGWRICALQQFSAGFTVDDVYMADDSTGLVTDFTGEVRVQTMSPDAEGFQNDFFPSVGTDNSDNVELPRTGWIENGSPAKYNYSGTVGAIDLYSIGNFTIAGTIFGVQANLSHRKDDVGPRRIAPMIRTASLNYVGADVPQYSDYTYAGQIWEENPALALPWTLTDLNQAQFGIKIIS